MKSTTDILEQKILIACRESEIIAVKKYLSLANGATINLNNWRANPTGYSLHWSIKRKILNLPYYC